MERTFQPASVSEATTGTGSVKDYFPSGNPMTPPNPEGFATAIWLSVGIMVSLVVLAITVVVVAIVKGRSK